MVLGHIIDKVGEQIFNFNFWWEYERPIRKSLKRVGRYMDEAIESLNEAMAESTDDGVDKDTSVSAMSETEPNECWKIKYESQQKIIQEQEQLIEGMQKRIADLELQLDDAEFKTCTTMEQFLICISRGQETIIMEGELYKLWKRYMRAAIRKKSSQTVNISGDWNVTFGYGENLIVLSVPYKGRNTIGVYRAEVNSSEKNIVFNRVE